MIGEKYDSMGPIIGASAAAAAAQRNAEEEERMTTYGPDDLQNDWEFKMCAPIKILSATRHASPN